MLSYLLYTSKSNLKDYKEIDNIILQADKYNNEHNITGILLFDDTYFLQILEGEHDEILNLYEQIKQDERHYEISLKSVGNIDHRNFPEWSMRLSLTSQKSLAPVHVIKSIENINEPLEVEHLLKLLTVILGETFTEYSVEDVKTHKFEVFTSLTAREKTILKEIVKGEAVKTIAEQLNISPKTVSSHIENIKNKAGCATAKEIIKKVFESGYIMYLI